MCVAMLLMSIPSGFEHVGIH